MTTKSTPATLLPRLSLLACLALSFSAARAADPAPTTAPATAPADTEGTFTGKVLETMSTAGYTYVLVDTGQQKLWAACTTSTVAKGDTVTVLGGMPMANFHSKSLNRDFPMIYFTGRIALAGDAAGADTPPALPPGHPALPAPAPAVLPPNHPSLTDHAPPVSMPKAVAITKAEGGQTVQEIVSGGAKLAGQSVKVRGVVVKYNAKVMGKNWLHLQDGSGGLEKNDNDLTVTTAAEVKLGDTVVVTGKVSTNKDFGAGYKYAVLLEDAQVKVE